MQANPGELGFDVEIGVSKKELRISGFISGSATLYDILLLCASLEFFWLKSLILLLATVGKVLVLKILSLKDFPVSLLQFLSKYCS